MSTIAIISAKPFDQAKQRLAPVLQLGYRRTLVEAMFADAALAVRRSQMIDQAFVVTADPVAARIAGGQDMTVIDDTADNHSAAAQLGIGRALTVGARRVLLIAGDCPLVATAELDELLARPVPERSVLIVPDRHGEGTNALVLTPPDVISPAFGEGSRRRHSELAVQAAAEPEVVAVPSLALDIDTPEDLDELVAQLSVTFGRAAHTRGMLSQLTRTRPR